MLPDELIAKCAKRILEMSPSPLNEADVSAIRENTGLGIYIEASGVLGEFTHSKVLLYRTESEGVFMRSLFRDVRLHRLDNKPAALCTVPGLQSVCDDTVNKLVARGFFDLPASVGRPYLDGYLSTVVAWKAGRVHSVRFWLCDSKDRKIAVFGPSILHWIRCSVLRVQLKRFIPFI